MARIKYPIAPTLLDHKLYQACSLAGMQSSVTAEEYAAAQSRLDSLLHTQAGFWDLTMVTKEAQQFVREHGLTGQTVKRLSRDHWYPRKCVALYLMEHAWKMDFSSFQRFIRRVGTVVLCFKYQNRPGASGRQAGFYSAVDVLCLPERIPSHQSTSVPVNRRTAQAILEAGLEVTGKETRAIKRA